MNTKDFTVSIFVEQDVKTSFAAIKNFREWWSEEIEGNTDMLNENFFYHYKDMHLCKLRLTEEVPDKRLVYHVIENQFSFTKDKTEWTDTSLVFTLSREGGKTKITFTHKGLVPEFECFAVCNEAWTNYITRSLHDFITTGKGQPNPRDKDGYNAKIVEKWKLK